MGSGNLELRVGVETRYASKVTNGHYVYRAIGALADFLKEGHARDSVDFMTWFQNTAQRLGFKERKIQTTNPAEVIIDPAHKLILYNLDEGNPQHAGELMKLIEKFSLRELKDAGYQVLKYSAVNLDTECYLE